MADLGQEVDQLGVDVGLAKSKLAAVFFSISRMIEYVVFLLLLVHHA